jgi:iron complex outermembrane receptor protein
VDAPSPVTVVTAAQITQSNLPSLGDALVQLPALRSSFTSAKGGFGQVGGSFLNLRNLQPFRTLVLVDGRRFVTTSQFGQGLASVNIEAIPQGLVKRIDTVTGGASAAYGSDAVAGVVNFIIDKNFEGLKGHVQAGETQYHDGKNYQAEVTGGGSFADGKGHIVADAEYAFDGGIPPDIVGKNPKRDWMANPMGFVANPNTTVGGLILIPNIRIETQPLSGIVTGGIPSSAVPGAPTLLWAFNPDGTRNTNYNPGTINGAINGFNTNLGVQTGTLRSIATGGDGWNPGPQSSLGHPNFRSSIYTRVGYDLTSKINAYVEVLSSKNSNKATLGLYTAPLVSGSQAVPIMSDNAYLKPDIQAALATAGVNMTPGAAPTVAFRIDKGFDQYKDTLISQTNRVVTGFDYQISTNWSAEVYYEYGETNGQAIFAGIQDNVAFKNAIDAVTVTAANQGTSGFALGSIVCRSSLASPSNGCVPYNPFGTLFVTAAQRNYFEKPVIFFSQNSQQVVEATAHGPAFSLPAGSVDVAIGAGYRKESLYRSTDSLGLSAIANPYTGAPGALGYLNQPATKGSYEIGEIFGEAQVPLLKDQFLAKSLDLNLAARYSDYSTVGSVTTWKAGLVYSPVQSLRFRTTVSRDVRAPNLQELASGITSGFASIIDPAKGNTSYVVVPLTGGNFNLKPEKADTFAGGVVFTPSFFPGAYGSIDYYSIKIAGEIAAPTSQQIINVCYNGTTTPQNLPFCGQITRAPNNPDGSLGNITNVNASYLNLASATVQGLDLELGYNHDLKILRMDGSLGLRLFGNYVLKNSVTAAGGVPTDTAKNVGRATLLVTGDYTTGPWNVGLQEHWGSGGLSGLNSRDKFGNYVRFPGDSFNGQWWTDLSLKRSFGKWEAYGSIINLFNRDPHMMPFNNGVPGAGINFDVQGRRFELGARFKL